MIDRIFDRQVFCPICRVWSERVWRYWKDNGDFAADHCMKCGTKFPAPKKKSTPWGTKCSR